jgi:HPt (histidine-containing phosphotransfer) domain-containing protein
VLDDLFEHIGADPARSIIEMFLGEARDFVRNINAAAPDNAGREQARRAAHSLKSSSGQLGASLLAAAAEQVEHAAAQKNTEFPALVTALQECASKTEAALIDLLRGRG